MKTQCAKHLKVAGGSAGLLLCIIAGGLPCSSAQAVAVDTESPMTLPIGAGAERFWQTIRSGTVTLPVYWADGATSAVVSVTDADGATRTFDVERPAADTNGSDVVWQVFSGDAPVTDMAFDVSLVQHGAGGVVDEAASHLVAWSGSCGGAIDVNIGETASSARDWSVVTEAWRLVPYDAGWKSDTLSASNAVFVVTASDSGGDDAHEVALADVSGYYVWHPGRTMKTGGHYTVSLDFGEVVSAWSTELLYQSSCSIIVVR